MARSKLNDKKLTSKEERFAHYVAMDYGIFYAYKEAGYNTNNASQQVLRNMATEVHLKPKIQARIKEIHELFNTRAAERLLEHKTEMQKIAEEFSYNRETGTRILFETLQVLRQDLVRRADKEQSITFIANSIVQVISELNKMYGINEKNINVSGFQQVIFIDNLSDLVE